MRDRIADSGLVGVAILTYEGRTATIDSFLLSCRVIGRGVEDALLSFVVRHALDAAGCDRVAGAYVPTAKNAMVEDFYAHRGFVERDRTAGAVDVGAPARRRRRTGGAGLDHAQKGTADTCRPMTTETTRS